MSSSLPGRRKKKLDLSSKQTQLKEMSFSAICFIACGKMCMECSESGVCLKCIEPLELIQIPVVKGLSDPEYKRTICGKPGFYKGRSALDKSLFFPQQRKHKSQGLIVRYHVCPSESTCLCMCHF